MKSMHHKKAEHHLKKAHEHHEKAADHHKMAKEHMAKHDDVREDKILINKMVKKKSMK